MARKPFAILVVFGAVLFARAAPADASAALRLHHVRIIDATTPSELRAVPLGFTVYVRVGLENVGTTPATHVSARLIAPSFNVTAGTRDYATIGPGETVTRSFLVTAAKCPPNSPSVSLAVSSDDASFRAGFTLPILCPRISGASLAQTGTGTAAAVPLGLGLVLAGIALRVAVSRREPWPAQALSRAFSAQPQFGSLRTRSHSPCLHVVADQPTHSSTSIATTASSRGCSRYWGNFPRSALTARARSSPSSRILAVPFIRTHHKPDQSSAYASTNTPTRGSRRMFRRRCRSLVRLGFRSTAQYSVSPFRANTNGTRWGRPSGPAVASVPERLVATRRRISS